MAPTLEITLLGGVGVSGSDAPLRSRGVALLAYLVLNAGIPQSRMHLAGVFWPDSSEAQSRTNLRRELHHLRAVSGLGDCLVAESNTLAWQDTEGCRVDLRTFLIQRAAALSAQILGDLGLLTDHASKAVNAYTGPLLPGWYDDWLLAAREQLEQQCIELCDRLIAQQLRADGLGAAMATARRRVQLAPLEELGYQQLIELQGRTGDRAGAMTTYHRCASLLERELGVIPSEKTEAVMRSILGPTTADQAAHKGFALVSTGREVAPASDLSGRQLELDRLDDWWRQASSGVAGLVVVSGEAGVGKSRLVSALATRVAHEGNVVASARCFGASGRLALAPVAEWLRDPAFRASLAGLDAVWRQEVERLAPSLTLNVSEPLQAETLPTQGLRDRADTGRRLRFFEGLARAIVAVDQPTLLILDDLQWCDRDTMLWLAFLLQRSESAPLLVVATARVDELADNLEVVSATRPLRAAGRVMDLDLEPLALTVTAEVAEQMLGVRLSDGDVAMLQAATGGYPLYVVEAVRNIASGGPTQGLGADDVDHVLRQRLALASEAAREVAGLAAAVGRDFDLGLLTEASELDVDSVVRAVDELWRRRILHQTGLGYDFAHDLLRDCAYQSVTPARQWLHHRRLAMAIESEHAENLDVVAAQLARHYSHLGRPDRALPYFARAASVASRVFAFDEAIRLLRSSLELLATLPEGHERDQKELAALHALSAPLNALKGFASSELESVLSRSDTLARRLEQPHAQLSTAVALWGCWFVQGRIREAGQLADRALELSRSVPDLSGQAHFVAGASRLVRGSPDEAVKHLELATKLSVEEVSLTLGQRAEVAAQAFSAHARWLLADVEGSERDVNETISRSRTVQHPYTLTVALAYAAITHQISGHLNAMDDDIAELAELSDRYDIAYYREWGLVLSGWRMGGTAGIARMRQGLANLADENSFLRMPYWLYLLADANLAQGDITAARANLDAARVSAVRNDDRWWLPEVLRSLAKLQNPVEARQTLEAAVAMAFEQSSPQLRRRCEVDLERLL